MLLFVVLSPPRVTLVDGACCMDKSTIPPTSLGSMWPARLLSATLSPPYPSWWQWCASLCLCTGSTLSAWKGNSQGNKADVSFSVCLCHFLCVWVASWSCVLYCLLCDNDVNQWQNVRKCANLRALKSLEALVRSLGGGNLNRKEVQDCFTISQRRSLRIDGPGPEPWVTPAQG